MTIVYLVLFSKDWGDQRFVVMPQVGRAFLCVALCSCHDQNTPATEACWVLCVIPPDNACASLCVWVSEATRVSFPCVWVSEWFRQPACEWVSESNSQYVIPLWVSEQVSWLASQCYFPDNTWTRKWVSEWAIHDTNTLYEHCGKFEFWSRWHKVNLGSASL